MKKEILLCSKSILLPEDVVYKKTTAAGKQTAIDERIFWDMEMFWFLLEERYGMNVSRLGRNASIPKSTIHSIVNGETIPNLRELAGLTFALELDADPFFAMFIRGYLERANQEMGIIK